MPVHTNGTHEPRANRNVGTVGRQDRKRALRGFTWQDHMSEKTQRKIGNPANCKGAICRRLSRSAHPTAPWRGFVIPGFVIPGRRLHPCPARTHCG